MELRFYGLQSREVVKARLNEAPEVRDNTHRTTGDDVLLNQPSAHNAFGGEKKPGASAAFHSTEAESGGSHATGYATVRAGHCRRQ